MKYYKHKVDIQIERKVLRIIEITKNGLNFSTYCVQQRTWFKWIDIGPHRTAFYEAHEDLRNFL